MKYPATRLADVALLATVLSSIVTGALLVISEVSGHWLRRPFNVPSLLSFLVLAFVLLLVNRAFYSRVEKARNSGRTRISWAELTTGSLTALAAVLIYFAIRSRGFSQEEWLAFFYISLLFAILVPQLIVRFISFVVRRNQERRTVEKKTKAARA